MTCLVMPASLAYFSMILWTERGVSLRKLPEVSTAFRLRELLRKRAGRESLRVAR